MKKDEAWLEKIKERLDEYAEPVPSGGWERLERDLPPARKVVPLRRWMTAVAALLVGAVSFIAIRLADKPVPDKPATLESPVLARHLSPVTASPGPEADALPDRAGTDERLPIVARIERAEAVQTEQTEAMQSPEPDESTGDTRHPSPVTPSPAPKANPRKENRKKKATELPPADRELLAMMDDRPHRKAQGWAVGLLVGNTGGGMGNSSASNGLVHGPQSAPGTGYLNLDLTSTSNTVLPIPEGQEIVFQNGVPYLQSRTRRIVSVDHKQPLSAGVSFRKNLPKGFSVETGLVYTYLASDILYEGAAQTVSQKLHYLGIPLRANWNFLDKSRFTLYVSAGGTVEKCIYGKAGSDDVSVDPLQLSVMAAVGAQYNIGKHLGIYLEPGIAYYFDDGSALPTIRKDNPCNFTLQAGVRLSY